MICLNDLAVFRIDGTGYQDLMMLSVHAHHDCFRSCRGTVINRGIGNIHAGQFTHFTLIFEDTLQDTLGYFSLIRSIGSNKLITAYDVLNHTWNVVLIASCTSEYMPENMVFPG